MLSAPPRPWLLSALLLALAPARAAQSVRLNDPLVEGPGTGDVLDCTFSRDGARLIFRADQLRDGVYELFSAPADGSAPAVRLNAPLPPGGNVGGQSLNIDGAGGRTDFLAAAGGRVVYVADQVKDGEDELWSVSDDGSAGPIRLNGPLGAGDVESLWLTPDGGTALFSVRAGALVSVLRVPVDGSAAPEEVIPADEIHQLWITADGARVVFSTGVLFSQTEEISVVPIDGSAAPLLLDASGPPSGFGYTYFADVQLSADGSDLVYFRVDDDDDPLSVEIRTVPTDGSHAPVKLNLTTLDGYTTGPFAFDGQGHVAYVETDLVAYSVALDGGSRTQLSPPGWLVNQDLIASGDTYVLFLVSSGGNSTILRSPIAGGAGVPLLAPGPHAFYSIELLGSAVVAIARVAGITGIYTMPIAGGPALLLRELTQTPPFTSHAESSLRLTPDGETLVFLTRDSGQAELYAVPLDASAPADVLSPPLATGGNVARFTVAPDGVRVALVADAVLDETFEVFGAAIAGPGEATPYNDPVFDGAVVGDVLAFRATSDGQRAVYRADQDVDAVIDLYAVRSDGRGGSIDLTAGLSGDPLPLFELSPTTDRVLFQIGGGTNTLYSAPVSGLSPPLALDTSTNAIPFPPAFDPGGTHVFYRKTGAGGGSLWRAAVDGSTPPLVLADPAGARTVSAFGLAPDGATAFYRADQDSANVFELYAVPADASAPSVKLSAPLVAAGDLETFAIAPDGASVAYRADQEVDARSELYRAPADGSAPALKLSGALVGASDVAEFAYTSDGARVVYRADQTTDERFELWSAPSDAGAPAVPLNGALVANGDVDPAFAAGAARVVYRADQDADEVFELFSAPSAGGAPAVQLSGVLVTNGDVQSFALAPDEARVVYLADQRTDSRLELFSSPADGSGPAIALDGPAGPLVTAYRIDPSSARVLYLAHPAGSDVTNLWAVPLDGSAAPVRLSRVLLAGTAVRTDFVPLADGSALYLTDQQALGVVELFHGLDLTPLEPVRPFAGPLPTRSVVR